MQVPREFDENEYSVTMKSRQVVINTQNSEEYEYNDSAAIYRMLIDGMKPVDFAYYLRRYVYKAAGYSVPFSSVTLQEYIDTVAEAFSDRGVPCSWKPTSTRLRAAVKNWLTQKTVSREAVIMLGFGLGMSLDDINAFMTKGLQESSLNPKDPAETVCWYCVKNGLGYYHFRRILSEYEELPGSMEDAKEISAAGTVVLRTEVEDIRDEKTLLRYLNRLRRIDGKSRQSVEARRIFDRLYDEAREHIAEIRNEDEDDRKEVETGRLIDRLSRDDRLYDEQKQSRIQDFSGRRKHWTKEDIMPVHFEEELYSAIPKDRNGNMLPIKGSALNEQFRGKRLNRQHIQEILDGTGMINRYDLETMSFFALAQRKELEDSSAERYDAFIEQTNRMLDSCGMGDLYDANPYDAFLKICMLTDYPLGTYADVWEMSYEQDTES